MNTFQIATFIIPAKFMEFIERFLCPGLILFFVTIDYAFFEIYIQSGNSIWRERESVFAPTFSISD